MGRMKKAPDSARAALAWSKISGLTPRRFWAALATVGDWRDLIGADPGPLASTVRSAAVARALTRPFEIDISAELEAIRSARSTLLTPFEGPYPRLLREIPDAPLVLHARGELQKLDLPCVAIVGA